MKKMAVFLHLALFMALSAAAYAQSLADIAKKEKERRADVKENRVITDEDVAKYVTESSASPSSREQQPAGEAEGDAGESADSAQPGDVDSDEPTDFMGRPESFWRETMAAARQKVKDLTNEANVIVLKIADLQNKFYAMDDGFNREILGRDIQKTYYEQDLNKENLEKAKAELLDLEKEARKSGALPGWVSP